MFYMREVSGIVPYSPGAVKLRRGIQPVAASAPLTDWADAQKQASINEEVALGGAQAAEEARAATVVSAYEKVAHRETPRRRVIFASEMMSDPVVTISHLASLREAQRLFAQKRFRHIPVLDDAGAVSGMLSDRDVLRHIAREHELGKEPPTPWAEEKVGAIMAQPILLASEDTRVREIARTMFEERIGCVPIVNEAQALVGIITRSDILRTLLVQAPLELWS